ncbi:hypothetical protein MTR62_17655, partial [Novosphingobium sp. 1949]|nr:hypothetical protein [Novosphingobium organovorum]
MKRMIAAFAIMGLAIAVAIYIAMAPLASPSASGSLNALLGAFDNMVNQIEAGVGRSTGALIAIGVGLGLSLVVGLVRGGPGSSGRGQDLGLFVPVETVEYDPADTVGADPFPADDEDAAPHLDETGAPLDDTPPITRERLAAARRHADEAERRVEAQPAPESAPLAPSEPRDPAL